MASLPVVDMARSSASVEFVVTGFFDFDAFQSIALFNNKNYVSLSTVTSLRIVRKWSVVASKETFSVGELLQHQNAIAWRFLVRARVEDHSICAVQVVTRRGLWGTRELRRCVSDGKSNINDCGKIDRSDALLISVKFFEVLSELLILRVPQMVMKLREGFCRWRRWILKWVYLCTNLDTATNNKRLFLSWPEYIRIIRVR